MIHLRVDFPDVLLRYHGHQGTKSAVFNYQEYESDQLCTVAQETVACSHCQGRIPKDSPVWGCPLRRRPSATQLVLVGTLHEECVRAFLEAHRKHPKFIESLSLYKALYKDGADTSAAQEAGHHSTSESAASADPPT